MTAEVLSPEITIPRYDISADEANQLCTDFLERIQDAASENKLGCYKINSMSADADLGRYVESAVFYETFGNDPKRMEKEYGPYETASDFYVVIDHEQKMPVGVMRIIKNSSAGLKSLVDIKELQLPFSQEDVCEAYDIDQDRCVDIATLAIMPEYRGAKADQIPSLLMYRTLFLDILDNPDFDHVITIIDQKAERNLKTLKFPFEPVFDCDYFKYVDSAKSRMLIAQNEQFSIQLTEWASKYIQEAATTQSTVKEWLGSVMAALVRQNSGPFDNMLAESIKHN